MRKGKRILILGASGMLGHKLVQSFSKSFDTYCTVREDSDRLDSFRLCPPQHVLGGIKAEHISSIEEAISRLKPDVVVNAIGIVKQLQTSQDVVQTLTVNSILPHQLARLASQFDFRLITVSTDCVFSGTKGNYSELDHPDASDLYGLSKYLGEVSAPNCLTLRTSIVGREIGSSHSLIEWFLAQNDRVRGYSNAIFSGFPTIVFAEIVEMIITDFPRLEGLYHVSSDPISKYCLLNLVKDRLGVKVKIEKYDDVQIDRSLDSSKFRDASGFAPLPWSEMIDRMFTDPTPYEEWRT